MTDGEFGEFVETSMDQLLERQERLNSEFGLGSYERWHFDQSTETLSFFDAAGDVALEADVIEIGSYASNSKTWKWAWSNASVLPALREKAEPLRQLQALTGFDLFGSESAVSVEDDNMAWELVAMSVRQLGALGAYRVPSFSKPLATFLAITCIRRSQ